ncbi:MAG: YdiU family protein [Gammaproteobacteria bacterium]|nr:YdiU family protein [Gammaproteobacteria bacterium]
MKNKPTLNFDNTYAQLPDVFYTRQAPTPLKNTHLVHFNHAAAALIDLPPLDVDSLDNNDKQLLNALNGSRLLPGMEPLASVYAGHQFGTYVPQLGDGRAILLGEIRNNAGQSWDLQLKGAGRTPYSRNGDGRAVLRSSIREYLCSEAMHGLSIPTTRALCLFSSDEEVYRETIETGALLLRMAPSHVRFGTFEYFFYNNRHEHLQCLADFIIDSHYTDLKYDDNSNNNKYLRLLETVISKTAALIAQWQSIGFAHGVLNTDNMSILGITIDYGPYGFLDTFNPAYICNHSDHTGRYAFDQQPKIGLFNLSCLAQALLPLLDNESQAAAEKAKTVLSNYQNQLLSHYACLSREKLGLLEQRDEDHSLHADLLAILAENQIDYTLFFRKLSKIPSIADTQADAQVTSHFNTLRDMFINRNAFDHWIDRYRLRLLVENSDDVERERKMNRVNPHYILRNYLAEKAIRNATEQQDYTEIDTLLTLLQNPYDEQAGMEQYAASPPDWAQHIQVSCSS